MTTCLEDVSQGETDVLAFLLDIPRRDTGGDIPWLPTIDCLIALAQRVDFPVIAAGLLPEGLEPHLREKLLAGGVTPLCGFSETLDALGQVATYRARLADSHALPAALLHTPMPKHQGCALDEWDGKRALAGHGLLVPKGWAGAVHLAGEAAATIGFPVALKVLSTTLMHKSRFGGVRLGLTSVQEIEAAIVTMGEDVAQAAPGHNLERVLVEAMVSDIAAEVLIGVKRHAELGLALVIGHGGVDVERLRAYVLVLMPATDRELMNALDHLRLAVDATARANLMGAIRAVESFAQANAQDLVELDVNPVMLRHDGSVVAADALVVLAF